MNRFLDVDKATEAILYISQETSDLFHIVKVLYYADKLHLEKYGRLITGDSYIAMEDGPVPSGAYDLIKYVRGDPYQYEKKIIDAHPERSFRVNKNEVIPIRNPDEDCFSDSDIECLDEAIKKYADMDGGLLWREVHKEKSYKKTGRNKTIQLVDIINLDIPNGNEILEFLDS